MGDQTSDLYQLKKGTAVLAACIVQTLNESDPSFQRNFVEKIERAYSELRDHTGGDVQGELELLSWTRELLTGFSLDKGQGKPFLGD